VDDARSARRDAAYALYLELAARGVCVRAGAVPDSMPGEDAGKVLGWVKANRAGLREILKGGQDPDLEAARAEGSKA
jgi:antirestriction protein ArdC